MPAGWRVSSPGRRADDSGALVRDAATAVLYFIMLTLDAAIAGNADASRRFAAAVERMPPGAWATPIAAGKWTPAQITEHVAIAFEVAGRALRGESGIPGLPRIVRPLVRSLFLRRVLKTKAFPRNAKGPKVFAPSASPPPAPQVIERLRRAESELEAAVNALRNEGRSTIEHPAFGRISVEEYLELNAIHTRHHMAQLPAGAAAARV